MKKILIFSNHPAYTYNLRKEVIDGFVKHGYEVTIAVPYGTEIDYFKKLGVKIIDVDIKGRSVNPIDDLKLLMTNVAILRKEKPDVVITYATKQNIYGGMAARIVGIPYIPMITGLGGAIEKEGVLQKITSKLYRMGIKKAQTIFVQNEAILKTMKKLDMVYSPTRMTPGSGVSLDRHPFSPYPDEEQATTFVFIGRIMEDKGVFDLIEAVKEIKKNYPDVVFNIIGHAELPEDLERVESTDKEGLINYLGSQSDVRPFIREAHATILPSYYEGMANVLLESAAAGRPVISTTVPGCKETYDNGISGLGFPAKDVGELVNAIERFIQMPYEKKEQMGLAGRKKMEEQFNREIILNMYIKEFKKIGSR